MYTLDQLALGIRYPELAVSKLNRRYIRWKNNQPYNPNGIDIFEEDWDNLIILDACRYDEFAARSNLPGSLESRISRGSATREFIRGNFRNRTLHDVVYVSANEWYAKLREEIDAELHSFEFVERDAMNGLTSRPETVTNVAQEAAERYPDKRLIVHYMQPHHPFLGETGVDIDYAGGLTITAKRNGLDHGDIVQAYRENLELVLRNVDSLLEHLLGLTVVTADHGELLGERERPIPIKRYSHPVHMYVEVLVKIPWLVHQNGKRKTIVPEEPTEEIDDFDVDELRNRLKELGYRI